MERDAHPVPVYKIVLAFAGIYIVWGSTYLAIAFAIKTLPAFLDWFSATGSADVVRRRLRALADVGLDYCYVVPGALGFADAVGAASIERIASEVVPQLAAVG